MSTFVALLRGINVGGKNKIPMKELKELCAELGFENARTVLASGNLVFESKLKSTTSLAKKLQDSVQSTFKVACRIIVLTAQELTAILNADPIKPEGRKGDWLTVMFCSKMPTAQTQKDFLESHKGPEIVEFGKSAIYIYYTEGIGTSKLDLGKIRPKIEGTVRNRNTLKKLESLLEKPD